MSQPAEQMTVTTALNPIERLTKDLKNATYNLSDDEARFLVDSYYQMQEDRKRSANQIRSIDQGDRQEPHEVLDWLLKNTKALEDQIKVALDVYSMSTDIGRWSRAQHGIGPVIAAGLTAHIDITKAPVAGHIWSFAGLLPDVEWKKGQKRPWNADLKTLCWKIGESFVKVSGKEDAYYGRLYAERKRSEWVKNVRGDFESQARAKLEKYKIGKTTDAFKWYAGHYEPTVDADWGGDETPSFKKTVINDNGMGDGIRMLPPAHIHARAKRYAVKMFLSHWHHMAYQYHYGKLPPKPFAIAHLDHVHMIDPPNQKL